MNPPFIEKIMSKILILMRNLCENAIKDDKFLFFMFAMPDWKDMEEYKKTI